MIGPGEIFMATSWAYAALVAVTLLDAFVPVLPAETSVITGGVLASAGHVHFALVIAAAAGGAWAGDVLTYRTGRALGPSVVRRRERGGQSARTHRLRRVLATSQGRWLILARFVPGGRTIVGFAAGATRFPFARFLRLTLLASVLWAGFAAMLGYLGGEVFGDRLWLAVLTSKGTVAVLLLMAEAGRRILHRAGAPLM